MSKLSITAAISETPYLTMLNSSVELTPPISSSANYGTIDQWQSRTLCYVQTATTLENVSEASFVTGYTGSSSVSGISCNGANPISINTSGDFSLFVATSANVQPLDILGGKLAVKNDTYVAHQTDKTLFDWDEVGTNAITVGSETNCEGWEFKSVGIQYQNKPGNISDERLKASFSGSRNYVFRDSSNIIMERKHYNVTSISTISRYLTFAYSLNGSFNGGSNVNVVIPGGTGSRFLLVNQTFFPYKEEGSLFFKERREYKTISNYENEGDFL